MNILRVTSQPCHLLSPFLPAFFPWQNNCHFYSGIFYTEEVKKRRSFQFSEPVVCFFSKGGFLVPVHFHYFHSFQSEILSTTLLVCCQVYRNPLSQIYEGHWMSAVYYLMYLCKCIPSSDCLFISRCMERHDEHLCMCLCRCPVI